MWADGMTDGLRKLLQSGKCEIRKEEINKVVYENEDVKMLTSEKGKRERKKRRQEL